ncbi:MAG: carboxypeptidase-like regulatory domain-containing protein [bacterium]
MRVLLVLLLPVLALLAACGGASRDGGEPAVQARLTPVVIEEQAGGTEIFQAALPTEGEFASVRVPAVSTFSRNGALFQEASANVAAAGDLGSFSPAGGVEYAIYRFEGTVQDSIGTISVAVSGAQPGSSYWVGVADYASGRWDWRGNGSEGAGFTDELAGSAGQHSSPAGYIYVAVLSDGSADFSVASVTIEYLQRYNLSGFVRDLEDRPLEGVLVTTNLADPQQVLTAADGSFTLNGIPNGSWAVMATLQGWQFWPEPMMVAVSDADVTDLVLLGKPRTSGLLPVDPYEPNNYNTNAADFSGSMLTGAVIAALDDDTDCYRFNAPSAGWYYIEYSGDDSILYPYITIYTDLGTATFSSSYYVVRGATWLGYHFPKAGEYFVEVHCEGGSGEYSLELKSGRTREMNVYLGDSGDPGDGDDGIYDELYNCSMFCTIGSGLTSEMTTQGTGTIYNKHLPPEEVTVKPVDPLYVFSPLSTVLDFSSADQDFDFNMLATAPVDAMEPNDDYAEATPVSLPMTEPLAGWIGGGGVTDEDNYDYFSVDVPDGKYLLARVRFPDHLDIEAADSGGLDLYDSGFSHESTHDLNNGILELRSVDPLPAGTYYIKLFMEGSLMQYELEVRSFDALHLSAYYEIAGAPQRSVDLHAEFYPSGDLYVDSSDVDGTATVSYPFMPGERVLVYHERFGTSFTPASELVEFKDSDIELSPLMSYDLDQAEPNTGQSGEPELELPVQIEASVSTDTDPSDYYRILLDDPLSLSIRLAPADDDAELSLQFYPENNYSQHIEHRISEDTTSYYRADSAGVYIVAVRNYHKGEHAYLLEVNKAEFEVFSISGTLDNDEPTEPLTGCYVLNLTTGHYSDAVSGGYLLGYYPAGDYDVRWLIANRSITPAGVTTVTISNADVVLDYVGTYQNQDSLEPNDNSGAAAVLSLPATVQATLDYKNSYLGGLEQDYSDYYTFVAPSDGVIEASVTPWPGFPGSFSFTLSEDSWPLYVNYGRIDPVTGVRLIRYEVGAGRTYFLRVSNGQDLRYQLEVAYLP